MRKLNYVVERNMQIYDNDKSGDKVTRRRNFSWI